MIEGETMEKEDENLKKIMFLLMDKNGVLVFQPI
jgi:hypothetical protein